MIIESNELMNVIKFKKKKEKRKNSVELSNPKEILHQFLCLTFTSIHFFFLYIYIYNLTSIHIYLFDYYHISKIMEAILLLFFGGSLQHKIDMKVITNS